MRLARLGTSGRGEKRLRRTPSKQFGAPGRLPSPVKKSAATIFRSER